MYTIHTLHELSDVQREVLVRFFWNIFFLILSIHQFNYSFIKFLVHYILFYASNCKWKSAGITSRNHQEALTWLRFEAFFIQLWTHIRTPSKPQFSTKEVKNEFVAHDIDCTMLSWFGSTYTTTQPQKWGKRHEKFHLHWMHRVSVFATASVQRVGNLRTSIMLWHQCNLINLACKLNDYLSICWRTFHVC